MTEALRQQVVVGADGRIVIQVPGLRPGSRAEVIVLEQPEASAEGQVPAVRLSSLVGSCRGMFNTPEEADVFLGRERNAWDG